MSAGFSAEATFLKTNVSLHVVALTNQYFKLTRLFLAETFWLVTIPAAALLSERLVVGFKKIEGGVIELPFPAVIASNQSS